MCTVLVVYISCTHKCTAVIAVAVKCEQWWASRNEVPLLLHQYNFFACVYSYLCLCISICMLCVFVFVYFVNFARALVSEQKWAEEVPLLLLQYDFFACVYLYLWRCICVFCIFVFVYFMYFVYLWALVSEQKWAEEVPLMFRLAAIDDHHLWGWSWWRWRRLLLWRC